MGELFLGACVAKNAGMVQAAPVGGMVVDGGITKLCLFNSVF